MLPNNSTSQALSKASSAISHSIGPISDAVSRLPAELIVDKILLK
jgi:hypothetical protein